MTFLLAIISVLLAALSVWFFILNNRLNQKLHEKNIALVALETASKESTKFFEEKIAFIEEAKKNLSLEFNNIANKIFETKGKQILDSNQKDIGNILSPLKEQLQDFKRRVEDIYDKESKDRVSLFKEVSHLKDLNQKISKDAVNLTNALKGQNKFQGTWGELVLERVLEQSGLAKNREYEVQLNLKDEKGKNYRPDVVVHLPDNKDIIIDSKASLTNYEQYHNAIDLTEQEEALKLHLQSIKNHIRELSEKNYQDLYGIKTLDFVLMFIPIEAAFLLAMETDAELFNFALNKKILLISPSTLLITLKTIHNMWQYEYQNQNSLKIAKDAGMLYDKLVGFVVELEKVGLSLDKAKTSYQDCFKKLLTGKGSLVNRAVQIKEMGLKTKKDFSEEILGQAEEVLLEQQERD